MLDALREKKNLILQGPPGTGKTWLATKLGYALCGERSKRTIESCQFHANVSYEDFVQGLRPNAEGKLNLEDGPFLKFAHRARADQGGKYILVVEEINRGQPAHIFGELLALLEADKRNQESAISLTYQRDNETAFHIPENLYVVGTMNTADRSLAVVDFVLRRRFAFETLTPQLKDAWKSWCISNFGASGNFWSGVGQKLNELNDEIENDDALGASYAIGHSFVVPSQIRKFESDDEA